MSRERVVAAIVLWVSMVATPGAAQTHVPVNVQAKVVRVEKPLSKAEALLQFRRHRPQLEACYLKALKLDATLQGKIDLTAAVSRDGDVLSTAVAGGGLGPEVRDCVQINLRRWHFRPMARDAHVEYAMTFRVRAH